MILTDRKEPDLIAVMRATRDHWDSITAIKDGIAMGEYSQAAEAFYELVEDYPEDANLIWLAPSKGGPLTTHERSIMKTTEFREAAGWKKSE